MICSKCHHWDKDYLLPKPIKARFKSWLKDLKDNGDASLLFEIFDLKFGVRSVWWVHEDPEVRLQFYFLNKHLDFVLYLGNAEHRKRFYIEFR